MPVRYKIDVMAALKAAGYSSTRLRREKLIGEATMQRLRHKQSVSYDVLAVICKLLNCQPGDILEYVPDEAAPDQQEDTTVEFFTQKKRADTE